MAKIFLHSKTGYDAMEYENRRLREEVESLKRSLKKVEAEYRDMKEQQEDSILRIDRIERERDNFRKEIEAMRVELTPRRFVDMFDSVGAERRERTYRSNLTKLLHEKH